jgi:hypothetical protein
MDRPVRPDPSELPRIKKAMRAARFMKWGAAPIMGVALIVSFMLGVSIASYVGVLAFLVSCGALYLIGYSLARCPRCGQVWWPSPFVNAPWQPGSTEFLPQADETQSFVCRRCRIDVGLALRDLHER